MEEMKQTNCSVVKEIEDIINIKIPVLNEGFVCVVDYMGDDTSITDAARISYNAPENTNNKKTNLENKQLINYLMRNKHTSPFEMCEIKFYIRLPIFVARQWIRHRTANINEYSARYSVISDSYYIPKPAHINIQSTENHQGRGETLHENQANYIIDLIKKNSDESYKIYKELIDQKNNISREIARMTLPVNFYTEMYWKIDLHNLLHFLKLRVDSHAQLEIREYANVMLEIVKKWVPLTYDAFENYILKSYTLSHKEIQIVKDLLKGNKIDNKQYNITKRELKELTNILE